MSGIPVVVESTEGNYKTEVESVVQFTEIVRDINSSEDGKMIIIGSLAIRGGTIKSMCMDTD